MADQDKDQQPREERLALPGAEQPVEAGELAEEALAAAQDAVDRLAAQESSPDRQAAESADDPALAAAQEALEKARRADAGVPDGTGEAGAFVAPSFANGKPGAGDQGLDLLSDVNLNVKIELGRTRMLVEDVLRLSEGAIVELEKLAGDPVDIFVNGRLVARGEVLVLNDNFCVRVHEILGPAVEAGAREAAARS